MNMDVALSTIKLFNAVIIDTEQKDSDVDYNKVVEKTISRGFIFSKKAVSKLGPEIFELTDKIGISGLELNSAFHKSWAKIKNANIEQLFFEQITHYLTTYGFQSLGVYDDESIYIPNEKLEIPALNEDIINIKVIKGYTADEIKELIMNMLESGAALKDSTMADIVKILRVLTVTDTDLARTKNKEMRIRLYSMLNKIPKNPIEFLRFLVYNTTDSTLLINSKDAIIRIKSMPNEAQINRLEALFAQYRDESGFECLAEIFNRFKPIFLAFRHSPNLRTYINKISKLSKVYHIPLKEDYLNCVTREIRNNRLDIQKLERALSTANTFRKIRLAYALKYRTADPSSIAYKIRNGKKYATKYLEHSYYPERYQIALDIVYRYIVADLNVKDKKIYIPEYIEYGLPATEKRFLGNIPAGTVVTFDDDLLVGIHWKNRAKNDNIDLDLAAANLNRKVGWDRNYRDNSILFSGDMTSAPLPNGASEVLRATSGLDASYLVVNTFYNCFIKKDSVNYKFFIAHEKADDLKMNYMVDQNNVVISEDLEIGKKQQTFGMLKVTENKCQFIFAPSVGSTTRTYTTNDYERHALAYLQTFNKNPISFVDILKAAGAIITHDEEDEFDLNLSPEQLQRNTILDLFTKSKE